ncbi:MAG: hypothetical protein AAFS10_28360, partial [Myxococcota bacterium]
MNWTPPTPQRAAWAFLVASALALFLSSSTTAVAQDQDDLEIVGFEAETLGDAINFVARTRSGKPIPPDRITLKTRRNIVRITYVNIPLAVDLGRRIDFNTEQLPHVTKGYAQRENRHQAIVRLKFDTRAEQVIKGHVVAPAKGGTAILLPFGDLGVAARFRMEHLPPDAQEAESKPPTETNPEVLALIDIGGGDDQPNTTPESAPNNNDEETTPQAGY